MLVKMQPWQLSSYIVACSTIIRTDEVIYTLASTEKRRKHDHWFHYFHMTKISLLNKLRLF